MEGSETARAPVLTWKVVISSENLLQFDPCPAVVHEAVHKHTLQNGRVINAVVC